ncbi:hypothetical protein [Dyella sp.]|uniref:hypothetical protein n=1 Tax=Dyella sp. TaxID=1869338 RepID=UPI0039C8677E
MSQPVALYNALIRRGIDDRALYRRALIQVREPGLRVLLEENAQTLDALIADLQQQVLDQGARAADHGTMMGAARGWFLDVTVSRAGDAHRDTAWVRCLARCECALLDCFERHAGAAANDDSARVLRRQLCRLHRIHLDMHCLAGTTHGSC